MNWMASHSILWPLIAAAIYCVYWSLKQDWSK